MKQAETNLVLTPAELNKALRETGLWKAGCQFLSTDEKETLLKGSPAQQEKVYNSLEEKMATISTKLSEVDRASWEVDEKGEIILATNEPDGVELITGGDVDELKKFRRPIEVVDVKYGDANSDTNKYNAIIHKHSGDLISIVKDTYKVVPNADIINPLMAQLSEIDNKWIIDPSHSFVTPSRMRLQLTFPELIMNDGNSDIAMSLFLHNSYDGSEGVRMMWGAIRGICSNGMVFGKIMSEFYGRHTKGFELGNLKDQLESTYKNIPMIQSKIEELGNAKVTAKVMKQLKSIMGERVASYVDAVKDSKGKSAVENQWLLYNILTYYISHAVQQKMRASYQMKVAQMFNM